MCPTRCFMYSLMSARMRNVQPTVLMSARKPHVHKPRGFVTLVGSRPVVRPFGPAYAWAEARTGTGGSASTARAAGPPWASLPAGAGG